MNSSCSRSPSFGAAQFDRFPMYYEALLSEHPQPEQQHWQHILDQGPAVAIVVGTIRMMTHNLLGRTNLWFSGRAAAYQYRHNFLRRFSEGEKRKRSILQSNTVAHNSQHLKLLTY